jgi:hypothetical protein
MKTVKVAISMPEQLLTRVDKVRRRRGQSRSEYFRLAASQRLDGEVDDLVELYRRGYEDQPETETEVEAAMRSGVAILTAEPWD